jgi:periplasmic protein TonB
MNYLHLKLLSAFVAIIISSFGWTQDLTQLSKEELIIKIEKLQAENEQLKTQTESLDIEKIKETKIESNESVFTPNSKYNNPTTSQLNDPLETDSLEQTPFGNPSTNQRDQGGGIGEVNNPFSRNYSLGGRKIISAPKLVNTYSETGRVVVTIYVDRSGNVIRSVPGAKGSTTANPTLNKSAKTTAMKYKFNPDPNAPEIQKGVLTIIYRL